MGLKFELKQSFRTPQFKLALIIEFIIVILHFIIRDVSLFINNRSIEAFNVYMLYPVSSYEAWIALDYRFYMYMILLLCPILAALPYSTSHYTQIRGCIGKNVLIRVGKKKYLKNKLIAVFINGGVTVCLPLLVDLLMCMAIFPSIKPEVSSFTLLVPHSSFSNIYYNYPLLYCIIELGFIFVFSGIWAILALACTKYVKYKYTIVIIGAIINLFLSVIGDFISKDSIAPTSFLAGYFSKPRILPFVVEGLLFFIIVVADYLLLGSRGDIE